MSALESICRVQATPKSDDAFRVSVFFSLNVKYEKSSVALFSSQQALSSHNDSEHSRMRPVRKRKKR